MRNVSVSVPVEACNVHRPLPMRRTARFGTSLLALALAPFALVGCPAPVQVGEAEGVSGALGDPWPIATDAQLEVFDRGRAVALRRFERTDGLGPAFNVTFCGACHERPVLGGGAGLYRNFFFGGTVEADGSFVTAESAGNTSGVIRLYAYGDTFPARPALADSVNTVGQRNPIPFFGVGLLAEIPNDEILAHADPDDADGDGISGRPNYERGFLGRFGVKSQAAAIEGFIRGPLFNHAGITTDPLTEQQRAELPIDSSTDGAVARASGLVVSAQASAPGSPTVDDDGFADPELAPEDLFDVIAFAMLTAAPEPEPDTEDSIAGAAQFEAVGCADCHLTSLRGPRGLIHPYTDLLIHDMGAELADGLVFGVATGSEFRTQPLWGVAATGPYLHDGRASSLDEAIRWHGGEAARARDAYVALTSDEQAQLVEFLLSRGGREQASPGLLPPGSRPPDVGAYGGPFRELAGEELAQFVRGRAAFDHEFGVSSGTGSPRFNGDSCRACHFDPVLGGAGPRDVDVMRHGLVGADGGFVEPIAGTVVHRVTALRGEPVRPQEGATIFEHRQTLPLFGLGLLAAIDASTLEALADPYDTRTPDGITGRLSVTDGGLVGRFGWKAQIASIEEFVRDAFSNEIGLTVPYRAGFEFGRLNDNDVVPDPEVPQATIDDVTAFLTLLGPPPRRIVDASLVARGEEVFADTGCAACHVPSLPSALGDVPLYSDLLLHALLAEGTLGIEDQSASTIEFRTPPLWGLSQTEPYLHSGEADTIEEAIAAHASEGAVARDAFGALSADDRAALLAFLESL